ncbi:MAG: triose-phosphate isomerase [Holosporales bacterium]|nr:triose-phosphate isomerase [Holosporales bacterium]
MRENLQPTWIVANFKENGSRPFFEDFLEVLSKARGRVWNPESVRLILCPPFPYIPWFLEHGDGMFEVGAQDCSLYASGAFTGEVSASMLRDIGCQWVLLGHSERRLWAGDTQESVAQKARLAFEAGVSPLICIGESLDVRQRGQAVDFIRQQVLFLLKDISPQHRFALAYEPLWAIGSGLTPSEGEIEEIHGELELILRSMGIREPLLFYGGSLSTENAPQLLRCNGVKGGLVGRPCLDPKVFLSMLEGLSSISS